MYKPEKLNNGGDYKGEVQRHTRDYAYCLNFYDTPPTEVINLEEFEQFALDRLQVLKEVEATLLRNKSESDAKKHVIEIANKYLPLHNNEAKKGYAIQEERRKDHISHFILRLAYCRSDELRRWLLKHEVLLFKYRYMDTLQAEKKQFLADQKLNWKYLSGEEKASMKAELTAASPHIREFDDENFLEVDFEKVFVLVAKRAVFIKMGKAYVPESDQTSLVVEEFRRHLIKVLEATCKAIPNLEDDERVTPILKSMNHLESAPGYTRSTKIAGQIKADDVDQLVENFPLCMRNLHIKLGEKKHLKHFGRMQYNLFLKGIGLSLEQALQFWRQSFSTITEDQFQKNYSYNIRHNYGMEGKRHDYAPLNCQKIISNNPTGDQDHHGCPFRHFSQTNLTHILYKTGLRDKDQVNEILNHVKGHHYNFACTRYFEITRGFQEKESIPTIDHPNDFFDRSYKLIQGSGSNSHNS